MKKSLSLLLTLLLALVLVTGCTKKEEKETTEATTETEEVTTEAETEEETEEETEAETKEVVLNRGSWDGKTYTSEDLGLKFTVDDSWLILSDEQIATMMNFTEDMTDSEMMLEELGMYVETIVSKATGDNIIIMVQDLRMLGLSGFDISEEEILKLMQNQTTNQGTSETTFGEVSTFKFGESEYKGITMQTTVGNQTASQVLLVKVNGETGTFTYIAITASNGDVEGLLAEIQ